MGDLPELALFVAVGAAIGGASGRLYKVAQERGRGQWLSPVGRPPRDLYKNRWANLIANLIHEWTWIGFSVAFVGFILLFVSGSIGLWVMGIGAAMMLVRAFVTPILLVNAELAPQYEAQANAAAAARATSSLDPA